VRKFGRTSQNIRFAGKTEFTHPTPRSRAVSAWLRGSRWPREEAKLPANRHLSPAWVPTEAPTVRALERASAPFELEGAGPGERNLCESGTLFSVHGSSDPKMRSSRHPVRHRREIPLPSRPLPNLRHHGPPCRAWADNRKLAGGLGRINPSHRCVVVTSTLAAKMSDLSLLEVVALPQLITTSLARPFLRFRS